jgi:hypothetical protein
MTDDQRANCPDDDLLPCGCLLRYSVVDGMNTMTVSPCRLGCPNFATVLGMADEEGKDVEFRHAP